MPSGTSTIFSNTVAVTSKSVSEQIKLPARFASVVPQTQWNLIFTGWCSAQVTPFGQTTPISSSVIGATPPSGNGTADPLMNLGKTITLPGSVASLNFVSRTWANAGAASASAGTSSPASRAPLVLNFIVISFFLHPLSGSSNTQRLCQWASHQFLFSFSTTYRDGGARLSLENRTRPLGRVRFSGPHRLKTNDEVALSSGRTRLCGSATPNAVNLTATPRTASSSYRACVWQPASQNEPRPSTSLHP